MAGSSGEWERYERWNLAIAGVVFTRQAAGKPVYLDLDNDILDRIRDVAEPEAIESAPTLVEAVKGTLVLRDGQANVLRGHLWRLRRWYEGPMVDPPPTLALLAMLSLVAETMHDGDGMKPHNYWGRLGEILKLEGRQLDWFRDAYRKPLGEDSVSAALWESLDDWLEMTEGEHGLPTARPIGHEHIGYPLSQALVRQTDRDHFSDMFALNSLPPRGALPAFDMETLIAEWMSRKPCPASNTLEKLWSSNQDARSRITEVAQVTLESWDGTSNLGSKVGTIPAAFDLVRARVVIRSFPSRRIDIGLVIPARTEEDVECVDVIDANGEIVDTVDLIPAASGYLGLADTSVIDVGSFLGGEVRLRRLHASQFLQRRPRRAVPLRFDELLQSFVECERVQLSEESLILVRTELALKTGELLAVVARPGFRRSDELPGLPMGWTLFEGVQVVSSIPTELRPSIRVELNVLQPIATSQIVLQGGLRIPGNIMKWSSSNPPELRASAEIGASLSATIVCTRAMATPTPIDRSMPGSDEILIWSLGSEHLPDGDYDISIFDGDDRMMTKTLRLRSADHPAVIIDLEPGIAHLPGQLGYGLLATRTDSDDAFKGATIGTSTGRSTPVPGVPDWYVARKASPKTSDKIRQVHFPQPDERSCMITGAHLMDIETAATGMSAVDGLCKSCGLVRRYPAFRGKKKSRAKGNKVKIAPQINVAGLASVEPTTVINWTAAFDAVCHVGKGSASALDRIASQMEASDLFGDVFERRLEILGHIEIVRTKETLRASAFEVVDPYFCGVADGSAVLCGFRSERLLVLLEDLVYEFGGDCLTEQLASAPPIVRLAGLSNDELALIAASLTDDFGRPIRFVPNAALQLASRLPPLSYARKGLPATSMIAARDYESWDPTTARFQGAADAGTPGAFRLANFSRTYIYRTALDIGAMRATVGDARIVKYLAAADSGQCLLGYDSTTSVLYVPLGADLPGLYGRAAVFASGRPPRENTSERMSEYHGISAELAARLRQLLMT